MDIPDENVLDVDLLPEDGSEEEGEAPPSSEFYPGGPGSTPTSCASSPRGEEPASPHGVVSQPSFFHHQGYTRPFFTAGRRGPGRPRKEGPKLTREGKIVRRYRGGGPGSLRGAKRHRGSRDDALEEMMEEDDFQMPAVPEEPPYMPEKWPGKVCALCNLSERSQLGQGEMRQFPCSVEGDGSTTPVISNSGGATPTSTTTPTSTPTTPVPPGLVSPPPELIDPNQHPLALPLSRRQKAFNKCKTPLYNMEHTDELSIIGYQDQIELPAIVSSGMLYIHRSCLEFTPPFQDQIASASSSDEEKEQLEEARIRGIVTAALARKCAFCTRYGASIPCKMSCSKYFHFPCVLASGGFIDFQTKSSFCKDHLYQIPLVCSADIECRTCRTIGDIANLMTCVTCGAHHHGTCVGLSQLPGVRAGWACRACRVCQVCRGEAGSAGVSPGEARAVSCEHCDKLYHAACLRPIMATVPKYGWKCKCCRVCSDCGARSPGAGPSSRWHAHYTVCDSCYQQRNKGSCCPLCRRAYRAAAYRDMIRCTICKRYVHGMCDPDAEPLQYRQKKEQNPSYEYCCPICKTQMPLMGSKTGSFEEENAATTSQDSSYGDESSQNSEQDPLAIEPKTADIGLGKGKPFTVSSKVAKKKIGGYKLKGGFPPAGKLGFQKRQRTALEFGRKRGTKPKMRGVFGVPGLGLQRPQAPDNKTSDEDPGVENKLVLCSSKDKFVLTQDLCVACGAIGTDAEGCLIACAQCGQTYHPYCVNIKLSAAIVTLGWRCLECTVCEGCGLRGDDTLLLLCEDCDTAWHTYCARPPLQEVPRGAWRCERCRRCRTCGTRNTSTWCENYQECAPCASLVMCCVCSEPYSDGELIIQCETCNRWLHASCDSIRSENDAEICCRAGYKCILCRGRDVPPPHISRGISPRPAPRPTPLSLGLAGEYYVDDVCLSQRGAHHMKQLEAEMGITHTRRKRRFKNENSDKEAVVQNADAEMSEESKPDTTAEVKDEPANGGPNPNYKEGILWNAANDGPPPEGFTLYTTETGLTVLRRKRQRNLNKLGIGGFVVRQRQATLKAHADDEDNLAAGESPSNKRKPRRKPRSKLMEQFPPYMQEAFFGKELLEPAKPAVSSTGNPAESPGGSLRPPTPEGYRELRDFKVDLENSDSDGEDVLVALTTFNDNDNSFVISLNQEELEILSSLKPKEEKEEPTDIKIKTETEECQLKHTEDSTALKNAILGPQADEMAAGGPGVQESPTVHSTKTETISETGGSSQASTISPKDELSLLGVNLDAMVRDSLPDMDSNDVDEIFKGVLTDDSQESQESSVSYVNSMAGTPYSQQRQQLQSPMEYASPYHTDFGGSSSNSALSPLFSEGGGAAGSGGVWADQPSAPPPSYNQRSADKMRADESLGSAATISAVLYANTNHPEWKTEFPNWVDRCKQILKKWRALPSEQKAPYLQRARDNRSAIRMKKAQQEQERACGQQRSAREAEQERQWKHLQQQRQQQTQQQQQIIHDQRMQAAMQRLRTPDGSTSPAGPGTPTGEAPRSAFPAARFPIHCGDDINRQLRDLLQRHPDKMWPHREGMEGGAVEGQQFRPPLPVGMRPRHPLIATQQTQHLIMQQRVVSADSQIQQNITTQVTQQVVEAQKTNVIVQSNSVNETKQESGHDQGTDEMDMGDMDKLEQDAGNIGEVGDILTGLGGEDDEELLESLTAEIGEQFNILEYADPELAALNDAEHILDGLELADDVPERHAKREPQEESEQSQDNKMYSDLQKAVKNIENSKMDAKCEGEVKQEAEVKTEPATLGQVYSEGGVQRVITTNQMVLQNAMQAVKSEVKMEGDDKPRQVFSPMFANAQQRLQIHHQQQQQQTSVVQRAPQFAGARPHLHFQQQHMHFTQQIVDQSGNSGGTVAAPAAGAPTAGGGAGVTSSGVNTQSIVNAMTAQVNAALAAGRCIAPGTRLVGADGAVGIVRADRTVTLSHLPYAATGGVPRPPPPPPYPGTLRQTQPPPPPYPQAPYEPEWPDWLQRRPLLLQEQPLLLEELLEQEKREQEREGGEWGGGGGAGAGTVVAAPPAPPAVPLYAGQPPVAPPVPPDRPATEAEHHARLLYEQWLKQYNAFAADQQRYYEVEVQKLRKIRKSLNSKQRQLRKSGNELMPNDAAELQRVSTEQQALQKHLEAARKQARQHTMLIQEYETKQRQQNPQLAQQTVISQQQMGGGQPVFAGGQTIQQTCQQVQQAGGIVRPMQLGGQQQQQQTLIRASGGAAEGGARLGLVTSPLGGGRLVGARTLVIEQTTAGGAGGGGQLVRAVGPRGPAPQGARPPPRPQQSPLHGHSSQSPLHSLAPHSPLHHLASPLQSPLHSQQSPLHHTAQSPLHPSTQSPLHSQQSPMHSQQSPMHVQQTNLPQQSPMHPQQSPLHPQQSPMHPQQSPLHPQQSSMHPQQSPMQSPMHQQQQMQSPMHQQQQMHSQQGQLSQHSPMHQQSPMHSQQSPMHVQQSPMHTQQSPMHTQQSPMQSAMSPQHFLQQLQAQRTSPQLPTPSRSPQIYQQSQIQSPVASHSPQLQNTDYNTGRFSRPAPGCSPLPTRFARPPHHQQLQQGMRAGAFGGRQQTSPLGSPQPMPSPGNPSNEMARQQLVARQQYSPMGGGPGSPSVARSPHVARTPTPGASPAASPAPDHGGGSLGHHAIPFPPGYRYTRAGLRGGAPPPVWPSANPDRRHIPILKRRRFAGKTPATPGDRADLEDTDSYPPYQDLDYAPPGGDDTTRPPPPSQSQESQERIATEEDFEELIDGGGGDESGEPAPEPPPAAPAPRTETATKTVAVISLSTGKPPAATLQQYKLVGPARLPATAVLGPSVHSAAKILDDVSQATVASVSIANQTISVPVLKTMPLGAGAGSVPGGGGARLPTKKPAGSLGSVIGVIASSGGKVGVSVSPVITLATSSATQARVPVSLLAHHQVKQKIVKTIEKPMALSLGGTKLSSLAVSADATLPAKIFQDEAASPDSTVAGAGGAPAPLDIETEISRHTELPPALCLSDRAMARPDIKSPDPVPEKIPDNIMEGDDDDRPDEPPPLAPPAPPQPSVPVSAPGDTVLKTIKAIANQTKEISYANDVLDSNMAITSEMTQDSVQISIPSPTPSQERYLNDMTMREHPDAGDADRKHVETFEDMLCMLENIEHRARPQPSRGADAPAPAPAPAPPGDAAVTVPQLSPLSQPAELTSNMASVSQQLRTIMSSLNQKLEPARKADATTPTQVNFETLLPSSKVEARAPPTPRPPPPVAPDSLPMSAASAVGSRVNTLSQGGGAGARKSPTVSPIASPVLHQPSPLMKSPARSPLVAPQQFTPLEEVVASTASQIVQMPALSRIQPGSTPSSGAITTGIVTYQRSPSLPTSILSHTLLQPTRQMTAPPVSFSQQSISSSQPPALVMTSRPPLAAPPNVTVRTHTIVSPAMSPMQSKPQPPGSINFINASKLLHTQLTSPLKRSKSTDDPKSEVIVGHIQPTKRHSVEAVVVKSEPMETDGDSGAGASAGGTDKSGQRNDDSQNVLLKQLLQTTTGAGGGGPARPPPPQRAAPALGSIPSLEAQLARPSIPPPTLVDVDLAKPPPRHAPPPATTGPPPQTPTTPHTVPASAPSPLLHTSTHSLMEVRRPAARPLARDEPVLPAPPDLMPSIRSAMAAYVPTPDHQQQPQHPAIKKEVLPPQRSPVPRPFTPLDVKKELIDDSSQQSAASGVSGASDQGKLDMPLKEEFPESGLLGETADHAAPETPSEAKKRKRREYQQKKRKQMQMNMKAAAETGLAAANAKKRPRKGSRYEEDYDTFIDNLMAQLRLLPTMQIQEPALTTNFAVCPLFGSGDLSKLKNKDYDILKGDLVGSFGNARIPNLGDYYGTRPFGEEEPPAPAERAPPASTQRGFYDQEFQPITFDDDQDDKKLDFVCKERDTDTPDTIVSCSSPEGYDLDMFAPTRCPALRLIDDEDEDDGEEAGPGRLSPVIPLIAPVPIRLKPVAPALSDQPTNDDDDTQKALRTLDADSPKKIKMEDSPGAGGSDPNENVTVTLTLTSGAAEDILGVLKELAGILHIPPPTAYQIVERTATPPSHKLGLYRSKGKDGKEGTPIDIQSILNGAAKFCRHCDVVILESVVRAKASEFPLLAANRGTAGAGEILCDQDSDLYFCSTQCYERFAWRPTNIILDGRSRPARARTAAAKEEGGESEGGTTPGAGKDRDDFDTASNESMETDELDTKPDIKDEKMDLSFMDSLDNDELMKEVGDDVSALDEELTRGSPPASTPAQPAQGKEKYRGVRYKAWAPGCIGPASRYKRPTDRELAELVFRTGVARAPVCREDSRRCQLCGLQGDGVADGVARLLNSDVDRWVHLNCALWSEGVYETVSGALVHVDEALAAGASATCAACRRLGATLRCFKLRCGAVYHLGCALKDGAVFYKNKTAFCASHAPKNEKDNELTTLSVQRRVYIQRDEQRQIASVMLHSDTNHLIRVGGLIFLSPGHLLPHQLAAFHTPNYIYPIGYKIVRFYWSTVRANARCRYLCWISEEEGRPRFHVRGQDEQIEAAAPTPRAAWAQILDAVAALREARTEEGVLKLWPNYVTGEDLFGLTEPCVVRVLESLPGIETLTDYRFKYGRSALLEGGLAVNPSGCARCEPRGRTAWRRAPRAHPAPPHLPAPLPGVGSGTPGSDLPVCPYTKQFIHTKSSQYKKMKMEWRNNVYLARSKIQGLGLYAARDIEKHTMVIEYIGEIIRSELSEIREKQYEAKNRGIYMFRLDERRVVDATLSGGLARYINHSCQPNCVAETVEVDRQLRIIIFAKRRIARGEELAYDYKFDIEDDAHKIMCMCGAPNCRKWMN